MVELIDGKIVTELSDMSFLELVWQKWAGFNEGETEALLNSVTSEELSDEWLKTEGFDITMNTYFVEGDSIRLIKVADKEWIIQDASPEEMEEFVDTLMGEEEE